MKAERSNESELKIAGIVFDIKKFAIHDGPGIRTTVFLKGCPLRCIWCHNPESIERPAEISYKADKCIACGCCVQACPEGCHVIAQNVHTYDRRNCTRCGACVEACYTEALEWIGEERTVEDVLDEVAKDTRYFERSGGGLTLSGGEPMCQPEFTRGLLKAAKQRALHTCLDTCGCVPFERYAGILEYVDLFLFDLKETDPAKHKEFTGVDNKLIMANLFKLDESKANCILRCPIVPGCNDCDDHFAKIGELADRLEHVVEINVMPYHPYGSSKGMQIDRPNAIGDVAAATEDQAKAWIAEVQSHTSAPVKRG